MCSWAWEDASASALRASRNWTSVQQEVPGLESVACDGAGTPVWRLGTLRVVLTGLVAAPCMDLEFIGAKEGESPAFRQMLPRVETPSGSISRW